MSFRNVSLLFITLLLASVLLLQWWSIRNFTNDVSRQVGESAFQVSRTTAETLIFDQPRVEFRTFALSGTKMQLDNKTVSKLVTRLRQDVTIQLQNKRNDEFILLNADGSEYQIPIPRTGIHRALEEFSSNVLYATLALLLLGILLAAYFTHRLTSPLRKLQTASVELGSGQLGTQINKDSHWHGSEISTTVDSFNKMSTQIAQLQQQNKTLQEKAHLAELTEIARGLAHTIRNPLNALSLAIDQLKDSAESQRPQDKERRQSLHRLAKVQIKRIDNWIRSLMDIMSNDSALKQRLIISSLVSEVIEDLQLSSERSVRFNFNNCTDNIAIVVIESEIKSIIQTLLVNAIEASPDNGKIEVNLDSETDGITLSICDQGPGFSPEVMTKLFTPHNTDKPSGAGMGLYLAQRIISHKYRGGIQVAAIPDGGSRVTLSLFDRGN